jgi:hypothetical protein
MDKPPSEPRSPPPNAVPLVVNDPLPPRSRSCSTRCTYVDALGRTQVVDAFHWLPPNKLIALCYRLSDAQYITLHRDCLTPVAGEPPPTSNPS